MKDQQQLKQLIRAKHPCMGIITLEELYAYELIKNVAKPMKHNLWAWSVVHGVYDAFLGPFNPIPDTDNPAAALMHFMMHLKHDNICVMFDLAAHLDDPRTQRALRELIHSFRDTNNILILVDHDDQLPQAIAQDISRMTTDLPDDKQMEVLIRETLRPAYESKKLKIKLSRSDLRNIVQNLHGLTQQQATQIILDVSLSDKRLDASDLATIMSRKRALLHQDGLLEYVESLSSLKQIGGLRKIKRWLKQ